MVVPPQPAVVVARFAAGDLQRELRDLIDRDPPLVDTPDASIVIGLLFGRASPGTVIKIAWYVPFAILLTRPVVVDYFHWRPTRRRGERRDVVRKKPVMLPEQMPADGTVSSM